MTMYFKITSPDKVIYQGKIRQVTLPTYTWEITILPTHIPLISMVMPGIIKIKPEETENDKNLIYEQDAIQISTSKGIVYIDWNNITILTSVATTNPIHTEEILLENKTSLELKLQEKNIVSSPEEYETIMVELMKIQADLKLIKIQGMYKA